MPVDLLRHMLHVLDELRFRSTLKHIRVLLDGQPVADSFRAVLIWEPHRIVPSYAVPIEDVIAPMSPVEADSTAEGEPLPVKDGGRRVLDPEHWVRCSYGVGHANVRRGGGPSAGRCRVAVGRTGR